MVKFRQLIRPGNRGRDVVAVKHALARMNVPHSGALGATNFAGSVFVECIRHVEKNHKIKVDGIYGPSAHKIIAPHFSAADVILYKTAAMRKPVPPPVPPDSAQAYAKRLLSYHAQGKYRADNSGELLQIQLTAEGKPVWSQMGKYVYIDQKIMHILCWLIEQGLTIGTFAMCTDHSYDSPLGHAGGKAVDISSINGVAVVAYSEAAKNVTLTAASLLAHKTPTNLHPWQLICDGYGNVHDPTISEQTIPNAAFYGPVTMSEHRNHIHYGVS